MKLLKYLGALAVRSSTICIRGQFLGVRVPFSNVGELSSKDGSHPVTVYLKLDEYRWWVGLWSESRY